MKMCSEPGCTEPEWKDRKRCGHHYQQYLIQRNGTCPNHPSRPRLAKGLCSTCIRRASRAKHLTTDQAGSWTPSKELCGMIDEIIMQVLRVRRLLARYLRTNDRPTDTVWTAYMLLVMADRRLSTAHQRYIYSKINADAPANERIPYIRSQPA